MMDLQFGRDVNSQICFKSSLEGSRKRSNSSILSQLSATSTSSPVHTTSTSALDCHNASTNDRFVSTLKRSKRTNNLAELQIGLSQVGCTADELRMPMSLDLAALVSQPPVDYNPDGLDWESSGLFLSEDESHSDSEMNSSRARSDRFGSTFSKCNNSLEDICPPSKVRRQGQEGSALESWASLQHFLDAETLSHSLNSTTNSSNSNQPTRLLSLALPMQSTSSSSIFSTGEFSSRLTPLSHSGKQSSGRNHGHSSSSGNSGGSTANSSSFGCKQHRKLASSLASSIAKKTPGSRNILSSAATATAACAAAASSSTTFTYNGTYVTSHNNNNNSSSMNKNANCTTNSTPNVNIIAPSVNGNIVNSSNNPSKPVGMGDVASSMATDLAGQVAMDAILDEAADAFFH